MLSLRKTAINAHNAQSAVEIPRIGIRPIAVPRLMERASFSGITPCRLSASSGEVTRRRTKSRVDMSAFAEAMQRVQGAVSLCVAEGQGAAGSAVLLQNHGENLRSSKDEQET